MPTCLKGKTVTYQASTHRSAEGQLGNGPNPGVGALAEPGKIWPITLKDAESNAEWENEGGGLVAGAEPPASVSAPPRRVPIHRGFKESVDGCRERAAANLVQAAAKDTEQGRLRLENSAAAWIRHAELLQGLDNSQESRRAEAIAEWEAEEDE